MLTVNVICVGKLKEKFYLDAVEEDRKRLSRSCRLNLYEQICTKLPKTGVVVALCIEGISLSSQALARKFGDWTVSGISQITFLIGSSFGLHPKAKESAQFRLSMSPMTFPHHLARVMLLEQIYRAFQINEGSRYHK